MQSSCKELPDIHTFFEVFGVATFSILIFSFMYLGLAIAWDEWNVRRKRRQSGKTPRTYIGGAVIGYGKPPKRGGDRKEDENG